jgi:hypothetical protein
MTFDSRSGTESPRRNWGRVLPAAAAALVLMTAAGLIGLLVPEVVYGAFLLLLVPRLGAELYARVKGGRFDSHDKWGVAVVLLVPYLLLVLLALSLTGRILGG